MDEKVIEDIQWTNKAILTFSHIVDYLRRERTEKEVQKFVKKLPKCCPS